jgi:hypothetical protein
MITTEKRIAFDSLINQHPDLYQEIKDISYASQEKAKAEALVTATALIKSKLNNPSIDPAIFALELMPLD